MKKLGFIIVSCICSCSFLCSCGTNILDETASISERSYVSVILNTQDPQFMSYDDGNIRLCFYGEKKQGLPASLKYISYQEKNGKISWLTFDSQGRVTSFWGGDEVSILFGCNQNNHAYMTIHDPSEDLYLISLLNSIKIDNKEEKKQNVKYTGKQLPIQIKRKGVLNGADIKLAIMNSSIISYLFADDTETEGKYVFHIPDYSKTVEGNNKLIDQICNLFTNIYPSLYHVLLAKDSLIKEIDDNIKVSTIIPHTPISTTQAINSFFKCVNTIMDVSNIARSNSAFINHYNPVWSTTKETDVLTAVPYINGVAYNSYSFKITGVQLPSSIDIELKDEIIVDDLKLSPSFPTEGERYNVSMRYQCVPLGSTIGANICGSDGFNYSKSIVANNNFGFFSIDVPGTFDGVHELCTFNVKHNEKLLSQTHIVFKIGSKN